jgi:hypothetical protein
MQTRTLIVRTYGGVKMYISEHEHLRVGYLNIYLVSNSIVRIVHTDS